MRLLLFSCILNWASCSGQQSKVEQNQIGSIQLSDPKPNKSEIDSIPLDIYKNCIAINKKRFIIVINGVQKQFETENAFVNYLKTNANKINKRRMYVFYDSSNSFKQVISMLDVLKTKKIDNYELIDMGMFSPNLSPIIVQPPTSVSRKIDESDPADFVITILKNGIQIKHLQTTTIFLNASGLDHYIKNHKAEIDSTKIFVVAATTTPFASFKSVKEVLKKHQYFIFKIVANKQNE